MFYNKSKKTFFLLGLCLTVLLLPFPRPLSAQNPFLLDSSADRCVSLRKGQTCYKKITLSWQAAQSSDVCLHRQQTNTELQCWRQQSDGEFIFDFASDQDITFELRHDNDTAVLAEVTVKVSWVYEPKENSKSGWRIF